MKKAYMDNAKAASKNLMKYIFISLLLITLLSFAYASVSHSNNQIDWSTPLAQSATFTNNVDVDGTISAETILVPRKDNHRASGTASENEIWVEVSNVLFLKHYVYMYINDQYHVLNDLGFGPKMSCSCEDTDNDGWYPKSCTDIMCNNRGDCDDTDPEINPSRIELCSSSFDDDCNTQTVLNACPVSADGVCGLVLSQESLSASDSGLCQKGSIHHFVQTSIGWQWECRGSNGISSYCGTKKTSPVQGVCNTEYSQKSFSKLPVTSRLCSSGTLTSFQYKGSHWLWTCDGFDGGAQQSCVAFYSAQRIG